MNVLRTRVAGVPVPVIAAGLGAIIWLVFFRGRPTGAAASVPGGSATGSQLASGYGLGYAQGLQAGSPPASTPSPGGTLVRPVWQFGDPPPINTPIIWRATPTGQANYSRLTGGQWPGNMAVGRPDATAAEALGRYGWQWSIVPAGVDPAAYIQQLLASPTGVGGPKSVGSRSANVWHHAHPLVGARVPYQYHVRAVGGAPNHAREVMRVAGQSGVHPARLMMLNPVPTGFIRVA